MSFDPDSYLAGSTAVATPPAEGFDPDKFLGTALPAETNPITPPLGELADDPPAAQQAITEFSPDKYLEAPPTMPEPKPTSSAINDMARRAERGVFRALGYLQAAVDKNPTPDFYGRKNIAEYIPDIVQPHIDPARDKELKSAIAEGAGTAVPALGASLVNPVLGPVVLAGQMGEEERAKALAAGDTPEIANEKAKIGRVGGAVMGVLPGAKTRTGAGFLERVLSRIVTGAGINAAQDAAMQAATEDNIDWDRVKQSGKVGAGMGALFSLPDAARGMANQGRAAVNAAGDAFDGSVKAPEGRGVPSDFHDEIAGLQELERRNARTAAQKQIEDSLGVKPAPVAGETTTRTSDVVDALNKGGVNKTPIAAAALKGRLAEQQAVSQYAALPESRSGRYISADVARTLVPDYDPLNPTATNPQASAIADANFQQGLKDPAVKEVTLLAGGAGSGKSAAMRFTDRPGEMVYDGVFGSQNSLARLDQAAQSGKPVTVMYVYRPLNDALAGMFARRGGPTPIVPAEIAAKGHYQSAQNFLEAAKRYAGKPNVSFEVIDNSGPIGSAKPVENPIGFLEQVTKNRPSYEQALTEARNHPALGELTAAERAAYLGESLPAESPRDGLQSEPLGAGGLGEPGSPVTEPAPPAGDYIPNSESGRVDPAVMAALGRTGVGAAVGYYSGDTPEEKARNAAIGAAAGLLGPRFVRALRGKPGAATVKPVAPGGAPEVPPPTATVKPGPGVPATPGSKPLGLIESAKASPEIVPELRKGISGFYEPQSNAATIAEAQARIDAAPDLQTVKASLLGEQSPTAVSQATGLELIRKFQAEGKLQDAADVLYDMSVKAKNQGQAIQILSTLARDTPEGVAAFAQRLFGRKLTPEELAQINAAMTRVTAAKDPVVKLTRQAVLLDELARKSGNGAKWDDKASGAMNIAMLLNPKTIIRNIGGNMVMASADLTADMITPVVDAGVSVFTGRRTVSGPQVMEYARGLGTPARDFQAGFTQASSEGAGRMASFKEGLDTMAVMAKLVSTSKAEVGDIAKAYRSTFSSPLMRSLEKTMNVVMGGPDRAFYSGRLRSSLASQMKAEGTTVPTAAMIDRASLEAARAVYQDSNFVSTALRDVRGTMNRVSTFGKSSRFGAGQAIVPFVQVPGSLLMRGLEYSPAGFLKSAAEAIGPLLPGDRVFNQREFSQAMSKALLGSTAIAGTGYALAKLGIISGTPDPDPKVRAIQRSLGVGGGYTINVSALKRAFQSMDWKTPQKHEAGDVHASYDWAQPMSFPAAVGASLADSEQRAILAGQRGKVADAPGRVLTALMSGGRTLEEQPLLTGLTGFMSSAANAHQQGAGMIEALATSMATLPGQYVPAAARQVQQLMDNRVYETRGTDKLETAWQGAAANIPGLATELGFKPRSDLLGDMAERYQANGNSFFNVIVNPAFVTRMKSDTEMREIYRLWEHTGQTGQIPGQVDAKLTINGQPKVLTAPERADMQQFVGRVTRDAYKQLMRSEGYANASDEQRAKVLGQVVSAASTVAKVQLFGDRPRTMDKWDRALLGLSPRVMEGMKVSSPAK